MTATLQATTICAPTITTAFGSPTVALGGSTSLTFTLLNPNAGAGLSGVAFSNTLPTGLVVSTPNGMTSTCGGTVTATPDSGTISLAGATIAAANLCALSVNVKGTTAGLKSNTTNAVTSSESGPGTASNTASLLVNLPVLTVTKAGGGSGTVTSSPAGIDCGATCAASFGMGASVALGAAPSPGSYFKGWTGACTGTDACNVTVDANKSVGAEFDLLTATPRLSNLSTRMQVLTGNDVMIGGFVIGGSAGKTVVVRARGPSLVPFGIANALANPQLQLFRSSDQVQIEFNDDWQSAANSADVTASGFAPSDSLEAAILTALPPGAYTAIVTGVGNGTGVGIVEVFEVDQPGTPLVNISTRGQVLTGNDVMIGGFVIGGSADKTVVVRARGPSLTAFGVPNALANPQLQLVRSSDQQVVAVNDNWSDAANVADILASGFAPGNALESAILVTLPPGAYTAIVSGVGGATGVGIVEVFAQ